MGTFLNAVKNLINSLTAKTGSTASTADMVQLHDANGTPNGKISLADLASVLGAIAIEIPEGANLDDYKTAGIFYAENAARAQTFSNCPTNSAFRMEVSPTNFGWFKASAQTTRVQQRIWSNTTTPREYRRTWNGSSWGQWYEVSMTALQ